MSREASETWKYGDSLSYDLRMALADRLGVGAGNIIVGEGIDGLLGYLVRLVVCEGDKVVTSLGAYPTFNYHVTGFGGELVTVPYRDDHEDPEALIAKAGEVGAKLVYIANPDNPMGTWHDAATIQRMIDAVPDGTLLVLDEAYLEFAPEGRPRHRPGRRPRHPYAHLLKGLRHGWRAWLRHRGRAAHHRVQQDPQSLRHGPHFTGRCLGRAS